MPTETTMNAPELSNLRWALCQTRDSTARWRPAILGGQWHRLNGGHDLAMSRWRASLDWSGCAGVVVSAYTVSLAAFMLTGGAWGWLGRPCGLRLSSGHRGAIFPAVPDGL